jgi:hypothetical protein
MSSTRGLRIKGLRNQFIIKDYVFSSSYLIGKCAKNIKAKKWTQEREGSGTWFFPKTFFGHPFPTPGDTRRARRTLSEPITKKEKALTQPFDYSAIRQTVQQRRDDDYFRNLHRFYEKPVPKVKVRIPKDRKRGEPNYSEVHEYVVYYSLRPNIKRPNAVLIGKI